MVPGCSFRTAGPSRFLTFALRSAAVGVMVDIPGRRVVRAQAIGTICCKSRSGQIVVPDGYKWTALTISTLGMLMATIDGSITLISLPDIFRGIGIDPLRQATASTCCG